MSPAGLTVLAGPSGVGKGTVAALLVQRHPVGYLSVSATTRPPRAGEVEGENYFFLSRGEFEAVAQTGGMLEWAEYHGNLYGTPQDQVNRALAEGRPVLLEIDLGGARQIRAARPDALAVFLQPPSWAELERRLAARGTETPAQCAARLKIAQVEMGAASEFDHVLVNQDLATTVAELAALMQLEDTPQNLPAPLESCCSG
ncbi:MAG: guanylate kinase, partial [Bifidobacteriaceae bacterium]|nr:guanylate kinase [Bifidobacteriaceae bacterium]